MKQRKSSANVTDELQRGQRFPRGCLAGPTGRAAGQPSPRRQLRRLTLEALEERLSPGSLAGSLWLLPRALTDSPVAGVFTPGGADASTLPQAGLRSSTDLSGYADCVERATGFWVCPDEYPAASPAAADHGTPPRVDPWSLTPALEGFLQADQLLDKASAGGALADSLGDPDSDSDARLAGVLPAGPAGDAADAGVGVGQTLSNVSRVNGSSLGGPVLASPFRNHPAADGAALLSAASMETAAAVITPVIRQTSTASAPEAPSLATIAPDLVTRSVVSYSAADFTSGRLVFQLKAGHEAALGQLLPAVAAHGASLLPTGIAGLYELQGNSTALARLASALSASPAVQYAEPSQTYRVTLAPNDPRYTDGTLWGMNGTWGIRAPQAWDTFTGSTAVVVADIDTGVDYDHPDLYLNIWINQGEIPASVRTAIQSDPGWDIDGDGLITFWDLNDPRNQGPGKIIDVNGDGRISASDILAPVSQGGWANGISDDGDSYVDDLVGWNFVSNNNRPWDDHGHGTHTAGTIAGVGNNGRGVVGVNWKAQVMVLKFMNAGGSGTNVAAAAAIRYAVDHGARVSSNSWGGGGSSTLLNALNYANAHNHIFVAAAGNNGQNTDDNPIYPAAYNLPNIISVAAIQSNGARASFSNYGPTSVDLGAPGVNIYSTLPNNRYGYASGTSMATPHVAGVVTLVLAHNPSLTAAQAITRVLSSTTPNSAMVGVTVTGGVVNAAEALVSSPPLAPAEVTATAISSSQITVFWSDVSGETSYQVERSPDGIGGWTLVGTTAANVTQYQDTGLVPDTTYHYRVRAANAVGNSPYSAAVSAATLAASGPLFSDDFSAGRLNSVWTIRGGSWSVSNGVLSQTSTANADPRKAVLTDKTYPAAVQIQARVRVDSWTDGDYARAGVGLYTDPATGRGYNLVFHYSGGTRHKVQFLNDGVVWGNSYDFNWSLHTWYWFKLKMENGVLSGKVWVDGTAEPAQWMFTQSGWTGRSGGAPALNGGSAAGSNGNSTVSFDDVTVSIP